MLITSMPTGKTVASADMINHLQGLIDGLLPVHIGKLTEITRAMLPSLKGGAMFDSLADTIIINIPAFCKATKVGYTEIKVAAHSVKFVLPSYDVETVRFFCLALSGLLTQPDYDKEWNDACKLTALIDYVIPVLQGLTSVVTTDNAKVDYSQAVQTLGLDFVTAIAGVTYDNYTTGAGKTNHGLSVIIPKASRALLEDYCKPTKAKNSFLYGNAIASFDVIRSTVQDDDGIETIGLRYRFTVTKAILA